MRTAERAHPDAGAPEDLYERLDYFSARTNPGTPRLPPPDFRIYEVASAPTKSVFCRSSSVRSSRSKGLRGIPTSRIRRAERAAQIDQSASRLYQASGKIGQELRETKADEHQAAHQHPGGICEFDLPSYHYCCTHTGAAAAGPGAWLAPFLPIRDAVDIVFRLLRASGKSTTQVAQQGSTSR